MTMKVELSLHASSLKNVERGVSGTSDPFAVVTLMQEKPVVIGRTETITNTTSPQWVKSFVLDYSLGVPTKVIVSVFDENKKEKHVAMGSVVFDVGQVLGSHGCTQAKKVGKTGGTVFARVTKASMSAGTFRLQLKATKNLKNTEGRFGFRKPDPFFELSKRVEGNWDNVYRSKTIPDTLLPEWESVVMEMSTLCGGDQNAPIQIQVYDYETSGKHVIMGRCETTVQELVNKSEKGGSLPLKDTSGDPAGELGVIKAVVAGIEEETTVTNQMANVAISKDDKTKTTSAAQPNFLDYIAGGCELPVVVAIDFTGSNGDPRQPGTLHYMDPNGAKNDYEKAISSIMEILAKYDHDQKFPVVGFGAKYKGVVNHCFEIGGKPECQGITEVMQAYRGVFRTGLVLSSPTDFNQVIEFAASRATDNLEKAKAAGKLAYTILLIVTDGAVSDVDATVRCLEKVNKSAPLSIVIVAVGNADFSDMKFLDDRPNDRVQFVEFNKHSHDPVDLTSVTLQEIPDQLVKYFQSHGIPPSPPVIVKEQDIVVGNTNEEEEIDLSLDVGEQEIVVTGGGTGTKATWS